MADDAPLLRVSLARVAVDIRLRVRDATNAALQQVFNEAQDRVPVRQVFKGSRRITGPSRSRFLTREEALAEQAVRRQLNAGVGKKQQIPQTLRDIMKTQTLREPSRQAKVPTNPFLRVPRRITQPGTLEERAVRQRATGYQLINAGPPLSGRGQYELRSGRAVSRADQPQRTGNIRRPGMANTQATLGGRLKREIEIHEADAKLGLVKGSVVSPTYYARYVEFGTRHAAAQPYLRPALAMVRETYRKQLMDALRASGRARRKHVRTGRPAFGR